MVKIERAIPYLVVFAIGLLASYQFSWACQVNEFYLTKSGYLAAITPEKLNEATAYEEKYNLESLAAMTNSGTVVKLRGDIKVRVLERSFEHGMIKIEIAGDETPYWVKDGALKQIEYDKALGIHTGDDTRFTLKDGVIDDSKSGLQWVPAPNLAMNHYQAEEYVRNLSIAGGGWRLPTRAELKSIYDPSKPGLVDPRFKVGGWLVWSSEVDSDPSFAWYFNFNSGGEYKYTRNPACNEYFYVLAVRSLR